MASSLCAALQVFWSCRRWPAHGQSAAESSWSSKVTPPCDGARRLRHRGEGLTARDRHDLPEHGRTSRTSRSAPVTPTCTPTITRKRFRRPAEAHRRRRPSRNFAAGRFSSPVMAEFSQGHTARRRGGTRALRPTARRRETLNDADRASSTQNPTPDNQELLENAMYYQALAAYGQDAYDEAESDLNNLLTTLQRPACRNPIICCCSAASTPCRPATRSRPRQPIDQVNALAAQKADRHAFDTGPERPERTRTGQ